MTSNDAETSVAELVEFIERARMALAEAGRPELAERAHVVVRPDGGITLSFRELGSSGHGDPDAEKFLTLDPVFQMADQAQGDER